jgi:hypothetical protein
VRLSHPYAWVFLVFLGMLLALVFAIAAVVAMILRRWRGLRWPEEYARRKTWHRTLSQVESVRRVTQAGDFLVILRVPLEGSEARYREAPATVRWKRMSRLPEPVASWLETAESIPLLVSPDSLGTFAFDLVAVLGGDEAKADAMAREIFVNQGRWVWKSLPESAVAAAA